MYKRFSALLPKRIIEGLRTQLEYLNISINERKFAGFLIIYSLAMSAGIAINLFLFFRIPLWIAFAACFGFIVICTYLWLSIAAEGKGKFVERILPDALQLIASNMKSGLTAERALFVSARPEFGPLERELKRASAKIMSGERVEIALMELPKRIKSKILERTVWLISEGVTSGGQVADLLLQLSDDIREQNALEEEVKANISMYIMLIFFSTAIGAPALFGISTFIVEILSKHMTGLAAIPEGVNLGVAGQFVGGGGGGGALNPEFVLLFAYIALFFSCMFAGMTIGVINSGKEKNGVKFIPLLLAIAFIVLFAIRSLLLLFFGGIV